MAKTVPISVRLSQEDAAFIANLEVHDAVTPSDKVRSIIKEARKRQEREASYEYCLKTARETLRDLTQVVKTLELNAKQHSELVNTFNEWITESFAYLASMSYEVNKSKLDLVAIEQGIAERMFRLFEFVARMGVTTKAPCYDKDIVTKGFLPIFELIQIINERLEKGETTWQKD